MPPRVTRLFTGRIYHIFNRTIDERRLFTFSISKLFYDLLFYYRSSKAKMSYSRFKEFENGSIKKQILTTLAKQKYFKINILAYCSMPNHFHLLLQQKVNGGISKYLSDTCNALTRHFNIKNNRKGPLFLPRFQAKHIMSREQLIHVSRYIHLNPYSSGLLQSLGKLDQYPWSSYSSYLRETEDTLCTTKLILAEFSNKRENYRNFVLNNAHHQRMLEYVKHAEKWKK